MNMNITIAIDSFKGSLSSMEAGQAVAEGIRRVMPSAGIRIRPLADGGEGTTEALTAGLGGELKSLTVTGPLGRPVTASYGLIRERKMAVLEMASAAGLTLISQEERNPLEATTYGIGEMIRDAIGEGCRHFLVGIGGSALRSGLSVSGFRGAAHPPRGKRAGKSGPYLDGERPSGAFPVFLPYCLRRDQSSLR